MDELFFLRCPVSVLFIVGVIYCHLLVVNLYRFLSDGVSFIFRLLLSTREVFAEGLRLHDSE